MQSRPSVVFLDRDGTIIFDGRYMSSPNQVILLPNAAESIAKLNLAGIPVVLATNQSGIGRGYFTVEQYEAVNARLVKLLAERGAHLDASYYCPSTPEEDADCRKPKAGMYRQAYADHNFDPTNPLFIGDKWRDLAPFLELGGGAILVESTETTPDDYANAEKHCSIMPSLEVAINATLNT